MNKNNKVVNKKELSLVFIGLFLLIGSLIFISAAGQCNGDSIPCDNIGNENECGSQLGCYWDDGCESENDFCVIQNSEDDCESVPGCEWKNKWFSQDYCYGGDTSSMACNEMNDSIQCDSQLNCDWQEACVPDCSGKDCGNDGCGGICGSCSFEEKCQDDKCINEKDIIIAISSGTNAHGENYLYDDYPVMISHSNIFSWESASVNPHLCSGSNFVLALSSGTNAHASTTFGGDYLTSICYEGLQCRAIDNSNEQCTVDEKCVVKLSNLTNAHLETCDNTNYPIEICCKSNIDCEIFSNNDSCLGYEECAWTPPQTTTNPAGGCCLRGYWWDPDLNNDGVLDDGTCQLTSAGLCTLPVSQALIDPGALSIDNSRGPIKYENGEYSYCAQVSSDLNYGYWYPVESY